MVKIVPDGSEMLIVKKLGFMVLPLILVTMVLIWATYHSFTCHQATAHAAAASLADIDRFISDKMAAENIPGLSVVVVEEEEITYLKGFGTTSLQDPSPVTPHTVFDLASCTKSFTALAVLLLRTDGLIDLDLPVHHYLPDFRTSDPEESRKITIRHLLNQTSGLPTIFTEPLAFHSGDDAMEALVKSLDKIRLDREPGSSFEYSNLNYSLLGALIEEVSDTRYEDYMEQSIFAPLGMKNTTAISGEAESMERADGHQLLFGHVIARNVPVYRSIIPAGWVMSSAEDMGKWLIVQLNSGLLDGRQVIPPGIIREAQTAAVSYRQNGKDVNYGMGWFVGQSETGLPMIWHGGDTSNFAADMILLPEQHIGVSVLVNSQNSSDVHAFATGVASLVLGYEVDRPEGPWWASWKSLDIMAIAVLVLSLMALVALGIYLWWRWRRYRRRRNIYLVAVRRRTLRIWRLALPLTPLVLLMMAVAAVYVVFWLLFGYNLFRTLIRIGSFTAPGVLITWWVTFSVICLWALALAGQVMFRFWMRHRVSKKQSMN